MWKVQIDSYFSRSYGYAFTLTVSYELRTLATRDLFFRLSSPSATLKDFKGQVV